MLKGVAASPGVAIGRAFLFYHEELDVPHYTVDESSVDGEIARFLSALEETKRNLEEIHIRTEQEMPDGHANIFQGHLQILEDPVFVDEVPREIRNTRANAEFVVTKTANEFIDKISQ